MYEFMLDTCARWETCADTSEQVCLGHFRHLREEESQ